MYNTFHAGFLFLITHGKHLQIKKKNQLFIVEQIKENAQLFIVERIK